MELSLRAVEAAAWGGAFLGGGGGGWPANGLSSGRLALEVGSPRLVPLGELPADALVVTVSMVGAPAARSGSSAPRTSPRRSRSSTSAWAAASARSSPRRTEARRA